MKKIKSRRKYGRSPMLLTLVAAPALLTIAGMAADMSVMYSNWSRLQKLTERAAAQGASALPGGPDQAIVAVMAFAQHHGLDATAVSIAFSKDDRGVTVSTEKNVPCYFGRIVGLSTQKLEAEATARSDKPDSKMAEQASLR